MEDPINEVVGNVTDAQDTLQSIKGKLELLGRACEAIEYQGEMVDQHALGLFGGFSEIVNGVAEQAGKLKDCMEETEGFIRDNVNNPERLRERATMLEERYGRGSHEKGS